MSYEEVFGDVMLIDMPMPAAAGSTPPLSGIDGERYYTDVFSSSVPG